MFEDAGDSDEDEEEDGGGGGGGDADGSSAPFKAINVVYSDSPPVPVLPFLVCLQNCRRKVGHVNHGAHL